MPGPHRPAGGGLTFPHGGHCLGAVSDELGKQVLKGVSRSFYLSLRLLPRPMRGSASLGYLLARISDTLADTAAAPLDSRLHCIDRFRSAVIEKSDSPRWPVSVLNAISDPRERHLLECSEKIFAWLRSMPENESNLVREVLEIIVSGQTLDLERFSHASRQNPVALQDDAVLEDYAWRVAGCVGAFWTKLGFLTLGERFSRSLEIELLEKGIAYGKGLQLVNILRDLPEDLATGRCYLPVADPHDLRALMECHARWLVRAETWVGAGESYAGSLPSRRLRAATVLPALIARKTLAPLGGATWETLRSRVKVPRSEIYRSMIHAFLMSPDVP
ncbi:MAG: squalene/phytoene synthase family protein [Verrucomicrobiota bacterium]